MNPEDFVLSEIKARHVLFHSYEVPKVVKLTETESRMVMPEAGRGRWVASYCVTGTVTVWDHEKVLETDDSYDCTAMWMYLMQSNGTNKISKMLSFTLWIFYNKKRLIQKKISTMCVPCYHLHNKHVFAHRYMYICFPVYL